MPLVTLFGNPHSKLSARMERWRLRLQPYALSIVHQPRSSNPADFMSRHPLSSNTPTDRTKQVADDYVNFIITNTEPKTMTIDDIKLATKSDPVLQKVSQHIQNNDWPTSFAHPEIQPYCFVKNELNLSADGDVIVRGARIVIKKALHRRVVEIAHEGHQGIAKTRC